MPNEETETTDETTPEEEEEQEPEEGKEESPEQGPAASVLDPDFLLMAFLAILVDVLDFVFELGTIVSFVMGIFFVLWMMWKEGSGVNAQELGKRAGDLQQQHLQVQAQRRAAKTAAKKALRRGILMFIAELIPIINLIPFWTIFVLAALRPQNASSSESETEEAPQKAPA